MNLKTTLATLGVFLLLTANISCANKQESPNPNQEPAKYNVLPGYDAYPLAWESQKSDGKDWTNYLFELIQQQAPELIQGADDVTLFCPRYFSLTTNERVNFWGLLVSGIVKYESSFDPTSRMRETTMGTDPVTGKPVYSEGLMQLSYQDGRNYEFCDQFDWNADKHLDPADPRKTILDPYKNLQCGVKILALQVRNRNRITLSKGVYWAVIRTDGKTNKIAQISALTKKMPGCTN
ncbi:MAG: hypothetical protein JSU04_10235 [Bdellovibrionales bacterium]|nr:hypothetical protein [Bdellovibrionales bacterium]